MKLTDYELERKKRIEENKARMKQLGLSETVTHIKNTIVSEKVRAKQERVIRKAERAAVSAPRGPRRRSDRVQGQPAPVYDERVLAGIDRERGGSGGGNPRDRRLLKENTREEIYTTEHVDALGSCEKEWILFVDGYDNDGNRIYDKVRGQTCHQCRQKTLGKRTSCSECQSLHGVFCGDCLYMRYGEHVEEVNENPNWVCPPCRDLCNCSFHRSRRGWAPTGTLYRRAIAQGYKSVAHYLVLNNLEDDAKEAALPLMPEELAEQVRKEMADQEKKTPSDGVVDRGLKENDALLVPSSSSSSDNEGDDAKKTIALKSMKRTRGRVTRESDLQVKKVKGDDETRVVKTRGLLSG